MFKNVIFALIVIAIFATVAYQMGWLSGEGENVFEDARESVMEKGEEAVDKARESIN